MTRRRPERPGRATTTRPSGRGRGEIRPLEEIMPIVRERFAGEVAQIELERDQEGEEGVANRTLCQKCGATIRMRIQRQSG
jgi:hypothetical protein